VAEDIVPLLEEYCYEDYAKLEKILGKGLVDVAGQRVRSELFESSRIDDLMLALVQPFTDIVTTRDATLHEEPAPVDEQAEDEADPVGETVA
jgi:5-methylcytosine-specific restriction protein B